jgi:hypothetical protein
MLYSIVVGALFPTGGRMTEQRIAVEDALVKTSRGFSPSCAQMQQKFMGSKR